MQGVPTSKSTAASYWSKGLLKSNCLKDTTGSNISFLALIARHGAQDNMYHFLSFAWCWNKSTVMSQKAIALLISKGKLTCVHVTQASVWVLRKRTNMSLICAHLVETAAGKRDFFFFFILPPGVTWWCLPVWSLRDLPTCDCVFVLPRLPPTTRQHAILGLISNSESSAGACVWSRPPK